MSALKKKIRIGELLIQKGIISDTQLQEALEHQKQTGLKLGRTLVELDFIDESRFLAFLSEQLEIPYVDLKLHNFDVSLIQRLPEIYARRFRAIILAENDKGLVVGMVDPMDIYSYDELQRLLESNIEIAIVKESELLNTLDLVYRRTEEIANYAEEL